jgi:hypothetical protein
MLDYEITEATDNTTHFGKNNFIVRFQVLTAASMKFRIVF